MISKRKTLRTLLWVVAAMLAYASLYVCLRVNDVFVRYNNATLGKGATEIRLRNSPWDNLFGTDVEKGRRHFSKAAFLICYPCRKAEECWWRTLGARKRDE